MKCDRQRPCGICARTDIECVYPPGPGRAPKRPRRALDTKLLDRLSRLEYIVKSLENHRGGNQGHEGFDALDRSTIRRPELQATDREGHHDMSRSESEHQDFKLVGSVSSPSDKPPSTSRQFGRLLIDETQSYYISNVLLASLGDEVWHLINFGALSLAILY